jgi:small subunit ribosomal protein S17
MKTTPITTEAASKAPKWSGVVVSVSMEKTIVVAVESLKTHPKYLKQYRSTKKYKVHAEDKKYAVGDKVTFQECRPISRDKHHTVVVL